MASSPTDRLGNPAQYWADATGRVGLFNDDAGTTTFVTPDLTVRTSADGFRTQNVFPGDGRWMEISPDGRLQASHPDGSFTYTLEDGSLATRDPFGQVAATVRNADGSLAITRSDGALLTWGPIGCLRPHLSQRCPP